MGFVNKLTVCSLLWLYGSAMAWAITESQIWVPKRYSEAKHKLLSTAVEAERSPRCVTAIQGSMVVEKTTAEAYYFVITCRDKNRKTYNLSYSYPVAGAMPSLLNEQYLFAPEPVVSSLQSAVPMISANAAWPLCITALQKQTRTMLNVLMLEDNPRPSDQGLPEQVFTIPFDAQNPQGLALKYQAHCAVDGQEAITIKIRGRASE
ncbi:hypothetical protein [Dasania marina]|uniref:hypothetical protein n=1 Tax=Dasania marina TaxID=471499 RepID=UPI0030DA0CE0|tara:strand:- start:89019 stop:89636 length:618 start_codon:yes stop_codon:yes gene_type:complete